MTTARKNLLILFIVTCASALFAARPANAGPPFVTDDPEPVEYRHWEVYISSVYERQDGFRFGTAPHVEINYGVAPNVQLHVIMPMAFIAGSGLSERYGYGYTELGVKWRFVQEAKNRPMIGTFPLIEAPTGVANLGPGTSGTPMFVPIWAQKSWGPWTTYGGGGYWINPGSGNTNYWLLGWLIQKDLNKHVTLGGEIYYTSSTGAGISAQLAFNLGGQYNFDEGHHLLFSIGRGFSEQTDWTSYVGFQWTFGPHGKPEASGHESALRLMRIPGEASTFGPGI